VVKIGTSNQDRTISLKAAVRSCINKRKRLGIVNARRSTAKTLLSLRFGTTKKSGPKLHRGKLNMGRLYY
jgi:hypothetical protein